MAAPPRAKARAVAFPVPWRSRALDDSRALDGSRAAPGSLCPASFFSFSPYSFFFFFFFPPFSPIGEPHDASLSASRRESPEDCFKKKSVCGAGRRGRAVLLTDDCTLERFAGGVPVPAAGPRTMASLRRPRPQPSHSPARGHGAATQKRRRRPTAAAPRAQSRRRAGHRPRAPAAALPH